MAKKKPRRKLAEQQAKLRKYYADKLKFPKPTGVECDYCDGELHFPNAKIDTSEPIPKREIVCLKCRWRGITIT